MLADTDDAVEEVAVVVVGGIEAGADFTV